MSQAISSMLMSKKSLWGGGHIFLSAAAYKKHELYLSDSTPINPSNSSKIDTNKDTLQAQTIANNSLKAYSLNSQVVLANKFDQNIREIDGSIVVVSGKDLQDLQINNTQDLQKIFPGFIFKTRASTYTPMISVRGISSADSYNPSFVIYVDGIPQDPTFLTQELLDVKQIELLRGPQGTIWGQNAQAGVLNIVTNRIDSNTPRFHASSSIGSLSANTMLSASAPLLKDWLFIGGNLAYKHFFGMIPNLEANAKQKQDTSDAVLGNISMAFMPKNSDFQAIFKYSKNHLLDHKGAFFLTAKEYADVAVKKAHYFPTLLRDVQTYSLKLSYNFSKSELTNVFSRQDSDIDSSSFKFEGYIEHHKTYTDELRFITQYNNGAYSIFGLYYQNIDLKTPPRTTPRPSLGTSIIRQNASIFGEGKIPLWYDFDFTLGARYSYDISESLISKSQTFDSHTFTPKVSLGYNLGENTRFFLLYAMGYQPGGYDFGFGKLIKPESSQNAELGLHSSLWKDRLSFSASLYYIYLKNKQLRFSDPLTRLPAFKNVGIVDSKGLELSLSLFLLDSLKISFGGTFGDSQYIKYEDGSGHNFAGKTLTLAPNVVINANMGYHFLRFYGANFFLNLNGNFYSKTYFDDNNTLFQAPYVIADGAIRIEFDNLITLNFYVQNIFNQKYANYILNLDSFKISNLRDIGLSISYKY